ncbi:conserved hypothetical protein [Histoplasma capsulatum G186AR]|uniref:Uncharacterized protein n=1 Tax=Ajellomyces capsulatus (strain G186AR / H82 / ATCC MYA-2454 / RMSCC 2432) TaxID=447093 RepID=C0NDA0_AJECG|nr:uncharacterized protein HCBG_01096 [Histoplasma capsulatum G186AR]EEH11641.1 conserved hypothetical protein [Histoplasma capsulatum G186AR]
MSLCFIRFTLTLLLLCKNLYAADCPLLGQAFPPPRMLSNSSTWKKAIEDFESNLKELLSQSTDLDARTTSFSINIFSSHEENLLYEYHHDAPGLKGSIAKGQKLNGDTMYRIASISKVMTLYTFLIEAGFKYFNEPVAKFVPEIEREIQRQWGNIDDTLVPQWREITVGSLANYYNDMAGRVNQTVTTQFGLPALSDPEVPRCGQRDMFAEFIGRHPVFAPFSTAIYSNVAFDIIGYALEQITNVPFEKSVKRSIIDRLKLKRFGVETPPATWGIIPSDPVTSYWNASVGSGNPAVGFYSSASDLARVGQSILQSRLISETDTRRWLKPNSHTSSLLSSVGSPWEIYRSSSPRLVDFYTKFGDLGSYGSAIALIPDYDVGFTVLAAGANPGRQRTLLADLIGSLLSATLEKEARIQAIEAFAGTYTSPYNENDMTTVVKISDEKDSPGPGLAIDSFYLNGVSFEDLVGAFIGEPRGTFPKVGLRLQPTGLTARYANRSRGSVRARTSFRVIADIPEPGANNNMTKEKIFSGPCKTWMLIDGLRYGGRSIDELVFELDGAGRAVALEMRITQQTLLRTDGGSP